MSAGNPKHFVFVPGSFHGAWCWYKMQPLLSKDGNTCEAIDLPAHGSDVTPVEEVTLDSYVNTVCRVLERYEQPVVLIGHSRAGIVISQVAEKVPEKIEQLVYLCAFLIPNGEPMVATAMTDTNSVLVANLILNDAEGWHIPKSEAVREAFYHDCPEEESISWEGLLTREPNAPVATPLQLSDDRFGKVKKVYIHTTQDKAISPTVQETMVERTRMDKTFTLDAGHSPFFSKPEELAGILIGL
jgi:pimeloyl-ACP methyl ester carboxylesterase